MTCPILDLWPQGPPESGLTYTGPEGVIDRTSDDQRLDRAFSNVSQPTLSVHMPTPERANGAAVVVFAGGGYQHLAIDKEGYDVARWLNLIGVTAIVVQYRTAPTGAAADVREKVVPAALADGQRAMRLVRHHAAEWGVDPERVGTLGFSAGSHLLLNLALNADDGQPDATDPVERQSCVPNFSIPVYPGVPQDLSGLGPDTGPMFIVNGSQDTLTRPEGAIRLYQALLEAGVPVEMHLFGLGVHGFGLGISGGTARRWPDLCEEWMRDLGILASPP
jgi:acetyl esterase/lipase